jgi:hypothetical protein
MLKGVAFVVRSTFQRGIVTAISWLSRPPYPYAAFDSVDAARDWALAQLAKK